MINLPNKKIMIGIVSGAAVLLLGSVGLFTIVWLNNSKTVKLSVTNKNNTNTTSATNSTTTPNTATNQTTETSSVTTPTDDKSSIYNLARYFTERYGSFSSDNHYENIIALYPFMTDSMQQTTKTTMANDKPSLEFYSVVTQAANVKITDYSTGASGATVEVATRRTETTGNQPSTVSSKTARLQLKQVSGVWQVDNFQWL